MYAVGPILNSDEHCRATVFTMSQKQEDQLPLRNRASAMHFFVAKLLYIAVMTYNCV